MDSNDIIDSLNKIKNVDFVYNITKVYSCSEEEYKQKQRELTLMKLDGDDTKAIEKWLRCHQPNDNFKVTINRFRREK